MEEEIIIIEEPEQVVEVIEAESSEEQAVIVTHDVEIDEINHDISRTETKTDAIWELTKGTAWEHQTDAEIAYEKTIPSDAKMLFVNKIGGMSVRGDDELITARVDSVSIESKNIELPKSIKDLMLYGVNENVYDYIDIEQKKMVRKCGMVTIDDKSTMHSFETLTNAVRMQFRITDAASGYTDCIFSNLDYLRSWDSEVTHGYMYNNTARVIINGITTREAAMSWLHDNQVTVVYALATPTETDLTAALYLSEIEQPHLCNSGKITFNQTQAIKVDIPNEVEYAAKVKQLGYKLIADITLESATTLVTIPNINCKNVQIMVVRNGQKTTDTADEVRVNSNSTGRVAAKFARTSTATAKIMAKSFIDFETPIRKMEYMTTYTAGGSTNFSMYYFTGLELEEKVNTLYFVATAETFNVGDEFIVYGR